MRGINRERRALQCDKPEDFKTYRIGLFGLDKLRDVEGPVETLGDINRIRYGSDERPGEEVRPEMRPRAISLANCLPVVATYAVPRPVQACGP
ncbi:hypothetical protein FVF58_46375 [Paraburkholderia panacisoli]|uniref:Uncharacterized protein n=1 Tax=Paraburkholderia panacisoli TaxID=2603818 RepID=A0A5B0G7L6_9BURK|nr:hypothetical protein FVF58_46375 [Paraburkholderia panacisoli]